MIKNLIILLFVLFSFQSISAEQAKCRFEIRHRGIYFNQCPIDMLVTGIDVWNPGPSPYPQVRVACGEPRIICDIAKNNLQTYQQ